MISMLSSCFAPSLPTIETFDSLHTESKLRVFRFFMKYFRTCDSVFVPSSSAIACEKSARYCNSSPPHNHVSFTLKFCPNFLKPIIAKEYSSFVQRWFTRFIATSSGKRPSRLFSFVAFKELIFCLFVWICFVFGVFFMGMNKVKGWEFRRRHGNKERRKMD